MEIQGKIVAVLPVRSGVSAKGTQWSCASYVVETQEQYPKKLCFDVFGEEKIKEFGIMPDEIVRVSFDIDAHAYNDRWFNSIRAWKVEHVQNGNQSSGMPATPTAQTATPCPPRQGSAGIPADDLPF